MNCPQQQRKYLIVGTYDISCSLINANNYTTNSHGTLTVTKAPVSIVCQNASREYGTTNPNFTYSVLGLKNSDTENYAFSVKPNISCEATKLSHAGEYRICASGGVAANYNIIQYDDAILTVTRAPLTLIANNSQREYYSPNPAFSFSLIGLRNNDDYSCLSQTPNFNCQAILESDCGEYKVVPYNAIANNYDISYQERKLTITQAPLTLIPANLSREYGDINPTFKYEGIGLKGQDALHTSLVNEPSLSTTATEHSDVGEYPINISGATSKNYKISYRQGILTIYKAPLTVIAENAKRVYGDSNPTFIRSYSGFKLGDTESKSFIQLPSISTQANQQSKVGDYEISVKGGTSKNYDLVSYIPGTLTIEKRNLFTKAFDCERFYNEENPRFEISFTNFVNGDSELSLTEKPTVNCIATKSSNAGTYPIVVTGGDAMNYQFVYQDGTLTVKPLTVGFRDVYNSVTYNDMSISSSDSYFNYTPEIVGPYNEEDFWLELLFLDKDNKYSQHVTTISGGDYAGNYMNTNVNRPMWAGKYIFNLTSKGTNPNVAANPSRAYLTVNRSSNNLEWNAETPLKIKVGEKIDLGISYQADLWCTFQTEYDDEIISLSSENETGNNPHWYATGLKVGETIINFGIKCNKNDMGFYDFTDSKTLYKRIVVEPLDGINEVNSDETSVSVTVNGKAIYVINKEADTIVKVFSVQGAKIAETCDNYVDNLESGIYIVAVGNKTFKVKI